MVMALNTGSPADRLLRVIMLLASSSKIREAEGSNDCLQNFMNGSRHEGGNGTSAVTCEAF